jgi:hypothetical protein
MYKNGKWRPVEIIPGIGEGERRENDEGGELKYDIFNILLRTFVNATKES